MARINKRRSQLPVTLTLFGVLGAFLGLCVGGGGGFVLQFLNWSASGGNASEVRLLGMVAAAGLFGTMLGLLAGLGFGWLVGRPSSRREDEEDEEEDDEDNEYEDHDDEDDDYDDHEQEDYGRRR